LLRGSPPSIPEDGCQLAIVGRSITVTNAEGFGFTSRMTMLPGRLRLTDAASVLELPYRIDGERLQLCCSAVVLRQEPL
jgi:hypothetical protein